MDFLLTAFIEIDTILRVAFAAAGLLLRFGPYAFLGQHPQTYNLLSK